MRAYFLLLLVALAGCGPSYAEQKKKRDCRCKYKEGEIVCLALTGQHVLVAAVPPDVPQGWYTVVVDYTNRDSRYPLTKRVVEFELTRCDSIPNR